MTLVNIASRVRISHIAAAALVAAALVAGDHAAAASGLVWGAVPAVSPQSEIVVAEPGDWPWRVQPTPTA
ncbi:hypothetical protein GCM10023148_40060 [Actinokineospora soli]